MKAIVLDENRNLELIEMQKPEPPEGHVRVKVDTCGICASDIAYWKLGSPRLKLPVVLGHEGSGIVDSIGPNVKNLKVGDSVIMTTTYGTCQRCKFCREGYTNLCIAREGIGSRNNGYLAEYSELPEEWCIPLPENMTFEEGSMVELVACCVHAIVDKGRINVGDTVVVLGPGPIGILAAQVAKECGAKVVLAGLAEDVDRFRIAKECGIQSCINQTEIDLNEYILSITDNYGADVVVECSGSYHAFNTALQVLRKKGQLIQLGIYHGEAKVKDLTPVIMKEINIVGSASHIYDSWILSKNLISDGKIKVKPLITHTYTIEDYQAAFDMAAGTEGLKVVVKP